MEKKRQHLVVTNLESTSGVLVYNNNENLIKQLLIGFPVLEASYIIFQYNWPKVINYCCYFRMVVALKCQV